MTNKETLDLTEQQKESLIHDLLVAFIQESISSDKYNRILNSVFNDIPMDMRNRIMDRLGTPHWLTLGMPYKTSEDMNAKVQSAIDSLARIPHA